MSDDIAFKISDPQPTDCMFALYSNLGRKVEEPQELMISFDYMGKVTYGPNYTVEAAVKAFWENIAHHIPPQLAAIARIAELEAALKPFADKYDPEKDDGDEVWVALRAAYAAIRARPAP